MLGMLQGKTYGFFNVDNVTNIQDDERSLLYTLEFPHTLKFSGVLNHCLELKVGKPIVSLRNLNQSLILCNGTRLIIRELSQRVIKAAIITGTCICERVYIPRIIMSPAVDTEWLFTFKRKQFHVQLAYALTINKSQGQTLKMVGLCLPMPVLYMDNYMFQYRELRQD